MLSSLVVVLASLFGGVLYVTLPPASYYGYITLKCNQSTNKMLVWHEMKTDYIDGNRVLKYTMRECINENFNYKIKYIYRNFTTETDWINYYPIMFTNATSNCVESTTNNTILHTMGIILIAIVLLYCLAMVIIYSIRMLKR